MSEPFVGEICPTPYNFSPYGWAYCSGQLLTANQFQALYSILGNYFGGTPGQTFGVPNLKATAPMGFGTGTGLTPRNWSFKVGDASVQLTSNQLPTHDHATSFAAGSSATPQPNPQNNYLGKLSESINNQPQARKIFETASPVNVSLDQSSLLAAGGNGAHENQQPFLALNFCIALEGVYPVKP